MQQAWVPTFCCQSLFSLSFFLLLGPMSPSPCLVTSKMGYVYKLISFSRAREAFSTFFYPYSSFGHHFTISHFESETHSGKCYFRPIGPLTWSYDEALFVKYSVHWSNFVCFVNWAKQSDDLRFWKTRVWNIFLLKTFTCCIALRWQIHCLAVKTKNQPTATE